MVTDVGHVRCREQCDTLDFKTLTVGNRSMKVDIGRKKSEMASNPIYQVYERRTGPDAIQILV